MSSFLTVKTRILDSGAKIIYNRQAMLLIIDTETKRSESLVAAFSYMGILAQAVKPQNACREICDMHRAILINFADTMPEASELLKLLKKYRTDIPYFATSDKEAEGFTAVFPKSSTVFGIAEQIIGVSKRLGYPAIGEYEHGGIDLSVFAPDTSYFFTEVPLSAKERMIFRLLIRSYPIPMSAEQILKYAFLPSKRPLPSCIRTHVSSINKAFYARFAIKPIISVQGVGYVIKCPCELSGIPTLRSE